MNTLLSRQPRKNWMKVKKPWQPDRSCRSLQQWMGRYSSLSEGPLVSNTDNEKEIQHAEKGAEQDAKKGAKRQDKMASKHQGGGGSRRRRRFQPYPQWGDYQGPIDIMIAESSGDLPT